MTSNTPAKNAPIANAIACVTELRRMIPGAKSLYPQPIFHANNDTTAARLAKTMNATNMRTFHRAESNTANAIAMSSSVRQPSSSTKVAGKLRGWNAASTVASNNAAAKTRMPLPSGDAAADCMRARPSGTNKNAATIKTAAQLATGGEKTAPSATPMVATRVICSARPPDPLMLPPSRSALSPRGGASAFGAAGRRSW
jgi:hypothetical protein